MNFTLFLTGLSRVLNCPKVHVTAAGLVTTWFAVRYAAGDLPPTQRASLWVAFIGAVAVQLREIINAWTEEDVAGVQKGDAETPGRGDAGTEANTAATSGGDPPESSSPRPPVAASPRLLLPMIAFTLIALFAGGCQTPPELSAYREGLHQVDEPLYQAHLLLLDDAIKANLRTDADRQVVQQGINAAEGLYQQSKATQAAGAPTTAP